MVCCRVDNSGSGFLSTHPPYGTFIAGKCRWNMSSGAVYVEGCLCAPPDQFAPAFWLQGVSWLPWNALAGQHIFILWLEVVGTCITSEELLGWGWNNKH